MKDKRWKNINEFRLFDEETMGAVVGNTNNAIILEFVNF